MTPSKPLANNPQACQHPRGWMVDRKIDTAGMKEAEAHERCLTIAIPAEAKAGCGSKFHTLTNASRRADDAFDDG